MALIVSDTRGGLTLTSMSSYSGGTTVGPGMLQLGNTAALPVSAHLHSTAAAPWSSTRAAPVSSPMRPPAAAALTSCLSSAVNLSPSSTFSIDTSNATGGSLTYLGTLVSGSQGLIKLGTGTLILTGGDIYTGPTVLGGGTLQFSIAGNLNLSSNVSGGGGALGWTGPGTLTLTGSNSYTGGTVLHGGVLGVSALNDTASSNIGPSGTLTLDGGTLQYTGTGDTTARAVDYAASTVIQVSNSGTDLTFNGSVSGMNGVAITKTGSGTLTLGGNLGNNGLYAYVLQGTLVLSKPSLQVVSNIASVSPAPGAHVQQHHRQQRNLFRGRPRH